MKTFLLFITLLAVHECALSQQTRPLTFFRLPVLADSGYIASEAYVSCDYHLLTKLPLKNYSGSDPAITKLSLIIKNTSLNEKAAYLDLSDNTDTTVANTFEFYSFFTSQSADPALISKVEAGKYTIFFVRLEEGLPLMMFCLLRQGNLWVNHTALLYHPAIAALASSINYSFSEPILSAPLLSIPAKNSTITFDSAFAIYDKTIAFHFDIFTVNMACTTNINSQDPINAKIKAYCNAISALKTDNLTGYYEALGNQSRQAIRQSLEGIQANDMEFYKIYKSSYSLLTKAIDLGSLTLLLAIDPRNEDQAAYHKIYMGTNEKEEIKWINENHEFYLDNLLRTPEFRKVLFP